MAVFTIATQILVDGPRNTVAITTGDATAAITNQVLLDPALLTGINPGMSGQGTATLLRMDHIDYSITDGVIVQLIWDATTPVVMVELYGRGKLEAAMFGGYQNPNGAGTTGKILLTTVGTGTAGAFPVDYSILLVTKTVKFRPISKGGA
jgi:hypothetical protein